MHEKTIPLALPPGLQGLDIKLSDCMGIPYIPLNEAAFQLLQNADLIGKEFAGNLAPSFAEIQRSFVQHVVEQSGSARLPFRKEDEQRALEAFRQWAVPTDLPEANGVRRFLAGLTTKRPLLPRDADTGMAQLLVANQHARNLANGKIKEEIWTGEPADAQKGLLYVSRHPVNAQVVESKDPYSRIQLYLQGKVENKKAECVLLDRLQEIRMETAQYGSYELTAQEQKLLDDKRSQQTDELVLRQARMEQAKRMQSIFLEWWGPRKEQLWKVKDPVVLEGPHAFLESVLFPFFWERAYDEEALTNLCFFLSKNPVLVMSMVSNAAPAPRGVPLQGMRDAVGPVMEIVRDVLSGDALLENQVEGWMALLYWIMVARPPDLQQFFNSIVSILLAVETPALPPLGDLIFHTRLWMFSSLFLPSSAMGNPLLPVLHSLGVVSEGIP